MKTIVLYSMILISLVQCKKESDDCHFFITIQNNSNQEVLFTEAGWPSDPSLCSFSNIVRIGINNGHKYRPYPHPDCIEGRVKFEGNLRALYIVDPNNYTTEAVPCEEFEERNTILRTYVLTLEDLERMDYTINYPEDASIGVD